MLLLQSRILGLPIASVQAGHRIGNVVGLVINPRGLKIAALMVESSISKDEYLFLHIEDILEAKPRGIVIDHNEQLMGSEDLVRLEALLEHDFQVIEKSVVSDSKRKIGKVADFIVNTNGWMIQKIHVQPSLVKMFNRPDLIIDRRQIAKVTDNQIIVREATVEEGKKSKAESKKLAMAKLKPQAQADASKAK